MQKYRERRDNEKAICPYCGDSYQVEEVDYDDDEGVEKCCNCGKIYWLSQVFTVTHVTKPDCGINNIEHKWERFTRQDGSVVVFCDVCNRYQSAD